MKCRHRHRTGNLGGTAGIGTVGRPFRAGDGNGDGDGDGWLAMVEPAAAAVDRAGVVGCDG